MSEFNGQNPLFDEPAFDLSPETQLLTEEIPLPTGEKEPVQGLKIRRHFTVPGVHPFDGIDWELRSAIIANDKGEALFEQKNVEVPSFWSQTAVNVVVQKYFHGAVGTPERESSVRDLINRVTETITRWGVENGYFASAEDAETFYNELTYLVLHQIGTFNSPVWFNVGIEEKPQCSACFIMSVDDTMDSILTNAVNEGRLFKWGSGTGSNRSRIRSSKEGISGGGKASGPLSFMKIYDSVAGSIKSGGKTRRAAKMEILDVIHPDIQDFITAKTTEEKKAWALIEQGYDGSFNGEAYASVFFQNSNFSVRASDDFMQAVLDDKPWVTREVASGKPSVVYQARDLMKAIAEGTHICGDPGMQFDTTINQWHTCKVSDRIYASNPCSEYMFLDNSACNLASINLMKFRNPDGSFDTDGFRHVVDVFILAQEIVVDPASYPTEEITRNSMDYRPLGLGYANLGALLMSVGLPYDSDEGRALAGAITSVMCGEAYAQSARIAREMGAFRHYPKNAESFLDVIGMHRKAAGSLPDQLIEKKLRAAAISTWDDALATGREFGFRNAQVTVLAPTGTIAFMMDCDTTGVEPDIALVKYKKLSGGGLLKLVNGTVPMALSVLGYSDAEVKAITDYIDQRDTIEGAPFLKEEHLPVFDCAFKPANGSRSIHYFGHIKMMAAAQPFLSGAISKTVNMPTESTAEEIMTTYIEGWKLGLKAVAIYRDGSKRSQPLNVKLDSVKEEPEIRLPDPSLLATGKPRRRRLPDERHSVTHKFSVGGHEGYITVGLYEDGTPGEVFITMSKEGSTISGFMDAFATSISMALQYGVPMTVLTSKFSHMRFEPSGFTGNRQIPMAKSIIDYIFRWMAIKFLPAEESGSSAYLAEVKAAEPAAEREEITHVKEVHSHLEAEEKKIFKAQADAPPCTECGSIMIRSGSCYRCLNCGSTSGCS
ncbi:MAG: vitamin B12-dependent ribonucleotide reductase [Bacteroidetes bacterium]|nr:vitamin B12-dependent ribonucleotide reductase [Bacteroidota bacterium]